MVALAARAVVIGVAVTLAMRVVVVLVPAAPLERAGAALEEVASAARAAVVLLRARGLRNERAVAARAVAVAAPLNLSGLTSRAWVWRKRCLVWQ